jgi:hypothetical protein
MVGNIGSEAILALTLISVAVGLALAVGYHLFAARVQGYAVRRDTIAGPAAVIAGFLLRLAAIVVIMLALGYFTPLNIVALCLAFVVLFTALNIWSVYGLMSKQHKAPPSAGTPAI